jgi:hypothetical protein
LDSIQLRKVGERWCGGRVPIVAPLVEGAVGFGDADLAEHALVVGQLIDGPTGKKTRAKKFFYNTMLGVVFVALATAAPTRVLRDGHAGMICVDACNKVPAAAKDVSIHLLFFSPFPRCRL